MDERYRESLLTRRALLKTAGVAGAALLLSAVDDHVMLARVSSLDRRSIQRLKLKLGVVLPEATRYPLLQRDLLDGMRLYLAQVGAGNVELVAKSYGASPSRALEQARLLLDADRAQLLVGVACRNYVAGIEPLLRERSVPMIVCDTGANVISQRDASPFLYRSSLNYWQSNYALGGWAATALGKTAVIASSIYESGYDSLYAFQHAFEQAGGTVLATHITHGPNSGDHLSALPDAIASAKPDLVYAAYSGRQAVDFVQLYAGSRLAQIPLLGSGFLTDEALLSLQGDAALGIRTVLPWAGDLTLPERSAFDAAFRSATGRNPSPFAVQGYDTADLILRSVLTAGGTASDIPTFRQSFAAMGFDGVRGRLGVDAQTLELCAPLYLREVRRSGAALHNALVAPLGHSAAITQRAADVRPAIHTGWIEGYLCG